MDYAPPNEQTKKKRPDPQSNIQVNRQLSLIKIDSVIEKH